MTPKARQLFYSFGTIATGLLTVLVVFNVIDSGTAASLNGVIAALGGLFGTAAAGTAAVMTQKQIKNGVLSPEATAVDRTLSGLQDVTKVYTDLVDQVTNGLQRVQNTAEALSGVVPPVAPATDAIAEITGNLADAVRDATRRD